MLGAMTFAATLAVAADPTIIIPTSISPYAFANGIAPNLIDADTSGIFFTQPYSDGLQAPRGIYSITPGGAVALVSTIPTAAGVTAENAISIVPTPAGSGFTAGDKFAGGVSVNNNANDAIYRNGSAVPFIDGITSVLSHHQTAIQFDRVGSFSGALIVSSDSTISVYGSAGATGTLLKSFTGPAGFVLQAVTVAPTSYLACPGCIFVTAMPVGNINNPAPTGDGEILTVSPSAANGSAAVLFATLTGIPEPESIQFVTSNSGACNVGGFSYFATGYGTGSSINNPVSNNGAILAWTQAQIAPFVGHYLVQNEEITGGGHGQIFVDAGLGTQSLFTDTVSAAAPTGYQLEDTAIIQCAATTGTGCPATQGFWHKAANWPNVTTTVDGVLYKGATTHSMTIGGIEYSQAQLLLLMPSGGLHSGNFANSLSQFIAAVLNVAAGAQVTPAAHAAITGVQAALTGVQIFGPGPSINSGISAGTKTLVESYLTALDDYNSAKGLGCTEGTGLNTGSGKK